MRKGILRIGTLYDYRDAEKHGVAIGDKDEGTRVTYSEDEMDLSRPDTVPPFLRRHIRAEEGKYWKISNIRFQVNEKSPDYYVFPVSEEYNTDTMRDFDYDSCVQIDRPDMFFRAITECLRERGVIKNGVLVSRCIYENRSQHYSQSHRSHPALLKDPRYAYQKEVRAIWMPLESKIEPLIIECRPASKFCFIIGEKVAMLTGNIVNQEVDGEDVLLDGALIDNSTLRDCKLIFRGERPPNMRNSTFNDCTLHLEGPAALTLEFLKAMYATGGGGRKKVEQLLKHIRGDGP